MHRQKSLKKLRAQTRAANKRAARNHASDRKHNRQLTPDAKLSADLARLVEGSPISQREITDEEEQAFLHQVLDIHAKAVAQNSDIQEKKAREVLEALVQAGTLILRDDLMLVPIKPVEQGVAGE